MTESAAVGGGATQDTLRELRALGVRLSLDDFGTGASNLSLLVNCPVDEIKLDRTYFARPMPAGELAKALQVVPVR